MKDYLAEILCVIELSKRTQAAIILGAVFFVGINILGDIYVSRLQFSGLLSGLEQVVISKLMRQYDKAALVALIAFWVLAFKFYHRDKHLVF